jgi:hypothetical protein
MQMQTTTKNNDIATGYDANQDDNNNTPIILNEEAEVTDDTVAAE